MSEDKLSYTIEFESDEESLVSSISEAITESKPAIDTMLQEVITESLKESVMQAAKSLGTIQLDVELGNEYRRAVSSARQESSDMPATPDTVRTMLEKTASVMDETPMSSVVQSTTGIIVSQIIGYLRANPTAAAQVLESPASSVMTQTSRYGELSNLLSMLNKINTSVDAWGTIDSLPSSVKDYLSERSEGMETLRKTMESSEGKAETMTIEKLMGLLDKDTSGTPQDVLEREVVVAVGEGKVTVAQYDPVKEDDEQTRADRINKFLEDELSSTFTSFISAGRRQFAAEFGADPARSAEFATEQYGGIVDAESMTKQIGDVIPKPEFDVKDTPAERAGETIDLRKVVEVFNRIAASLEHIGEIDAAIMVDAASREIDMLGRSQRHTESDETDGMG